MPGKPVLFFIVILLSFLRVILSIFLPRIFLLDPSAAEKCRAEKWAFDLTRRNSRSASFGSAPLFGQ
jgi:hypothetical protein